MNFQSPRGGGLRHQHHALGGDRVVVAPVGDPHYRRYRPTPSEISTHTIGDIDPHHRRYRPSPSEISTHTIGDIAPYHRRYRPTPSEISPHTIGDIDPYHRRYRPIPSKVSTYRIDAIGLSSKEDDGQVDQ